MRKHKKDVADFYTKFLEARSITLLYAKYAKRLKKYWEECWTFSDHEGVTWNNNNAEAAVKAFAQRRRHSDGTLSEKGMRSFLRLLSLRKPAGIGMFLSWIIAWERLYWDL